MQQSLTKHIKKKYSTLYRRIAKAIGTGTFIMYTKAKQKSLFERLFRYENRLKQWGIAVASGAALFFSPMAAKGQIIFTEQTGSDNPLNIKSNPFTKIDIGYESAPTLIDIDDDGDLDAFIGASNGTIKYFQNVGSSTKSVFVEQTGTNNPLSSVLVSTYSTLIPAVVAFVDIDGDNDLDAFIGEGYGTVKYFKNTGSIGSPVFAEQTGVSNPFDGINVGANSTPTFADIDGDGDLDAFVGELDGNINYFRNIGSSSNPIFAEQTAINNPLDGIDIGYRSAPTLVDIDGDGDLDAFTGN